MSVLGFVLLGCDNGANDEPPPQPPTETPMPDDGTETTMLLDTPPVPATEHEGLISFAPYTEHDMHEDCTVADVSARLVNVTGFVELVGRCGRDE